MKMKIFGSDLDRTLIYSRKILAEFPTTAEIHPVEMNKGETISYISAKAKELLFQLQKEMLFVPVTTRTTAQYNRISLFQNEINPEYAITCNGAHILHRGEPLQEWEVYIQNQLKSVSSIEEIEQKLNQYKPAQWLLEIRKAESLFLYCMIDREKMESIEFQYLKSWAIGQGWEMSLQGRKLYFVPKVIQKWEAFQFLSDKLELTERYTAGDSLLDYELIKNSKFGLAPLHGEVCEYDSALVLTKIAGVHAADEILERVLLETKHSLPTF
ncbi:HAD family hydrolase [Bacillus sp. 2205SS5-2]|uniref:HAD family hydrolase n=1 Tax=Bacillus sp. 2205SS5-2 TaxID=3109031 RepID=UPI003005553F